MVEQPLNQIFEGPDHGRALLAQLKQFLHINHVDPELDAESEWKLMLSTPVIKSDTTNTLQFDGDQRDSFSPAMLCRFKSPDTSGGYQHGLIEHVTYSIDEHKTWLTFDDDYFSTSVDQFYRHETDVYLFHCLQTAVEYIIGQLRFEGVISENGEDITEIFYYEGGYTLILGCYPFVDVNWLSVDDQLLSNDTYECDSANGIIHLPKECKDWHKGTEIKVNYTISAYTLKADLQKAIVALAAFWYKKSGAVHDSLGLSAIKTASEGKWFVESEIPPMVKSVVAKYADVKINTTPHQIQRIPAPVGTIKNMWTDLVQWIFSADDTIDINMDKQGDQTRSIQQGRCYQFDGIDDQLRINSTDVGTLYISGLKENGELINESLLTISYQTDHYTITCLTSLKVWNIKVWLDTTASQSQKQATTHETIPANLWAWFKCDESDGITAYDCSGNGHHATITNATTATFHSSSIYIRKSWQNDTGYNKVGDVFIPRNEASPLFDVQGNALSYVGRVKYHVKLVESACANFDGIDDRIEDFSGNYVFSGAFSISFWAETSSSTASVYLLNRNGLYQILILSGKFTARVNNTSGSNGVELQTTSTYNNGDPHHVVFVCDPLGTSQLYIDNNLIVSDTFTGTMQTTPTSGLFAIAQYGSYGGKLWDLRFFEKALNTDEITKIYNGEDVTSDLYAHYPMSEGGKYADSGTGNRFFDVSGNVSNLLVYNTTEATFWGETQNTYHYNILHGFRTSHNGQIPALLDGSNAANGAAITNPAGRFHNGAKTKIKQYDSPALRQADTNNFWFNGATINSKSYADFVANVNSDDKIFADVATTNQKKNLLSYHQPQHDAALTQINNFTNA